jgi:cell division protein FtsB
MRKRTLALITIFIALQYSLWFAEGGIFTAFQIQKKISLQKEENKRLASENESLTAEVADLKSGYAAIEERARNELGLIKKDESYFLVVPQNGNS